MTNLLKFSLKSIKYKKYSFFMLILFLSIGFSLLFITSIGKNYIDDFKGKFYSSNIGENKIVVEKEKGLISSFLNTKNDDFLEEEIKKIKNITGVKYVYKSSIFKSPSVMEIKLLGRYLETDVFFMGIDEEMISGKIPNFKSNDNTLPLIISKKAFESVSEAILKDSKIKIVGGEIIKSLDLDIIFGKGLMFNSSGETVNKKGQIVGFSNDIGIIFIGVPLKELNKINKEINGEDLKINKLFIETDKNIDQELVLNKILKNDYDVYFLDEKSKQIDSFIFIIYIIILFFILLFIFIVLYSIMNMILLLIQKDSKGNSSLYAIGIEKKLISRVYLYEIFIIFFISGLIGVLISYISVYYFNKTIFNYNLNHTLLKLDIIDLGRNDFLLGFFGFLIIFIIFYIFIKIILTNLDYKKML